MDERDGSRSMTCEKCGARLDPRDHYRFTMEVYMEGNTTDPNKFGRLCKQHGAQLSHAMFEFAKRFGLTAKTSDASGTRYTPGRFRKN